MSSSSIIAWLKRYWALVVAGLLVVYLAGGASMSRFARDRAAAPPPVDAAGQPGSRQAR